LKPTTTWTQDILQWEAWVPPVSDDALTPERQEVLDTFPRAQASSPYYRVLAHEPRILRHRTDLFNEALKGETGLSRADRELAAVGSSRSRGCIYCASVHARAYSGLVKDRAMIQQVLDDGPDAEIAGRERAIVQFSAKLAMEPHALTSDDVEPLRELGFSDDEILDIAHAAAIFANANRLMLSLGQGVEPD
jgi:uncharacterized peroxidase-related enzyme